MFCYASKCVVCNCISSSFHVVDQLLGLVLIHYNASKRSSCHAFLLCITMVVGLCLYFFFLCPFVMHDDDDFFFLPPLIFYYKDAYVMCNCIIVVLYFWIFCPWTFHTSSVLFICAGYFILQWMK